MVATTLATIVIRRSIKRFFCRFCTTYILAALAEGMWKHNRTHLISHESNYYNENSGRPELPSSLWEEESINLESHQKDHYDLSSGTLEMMKTSQK